MPDLVLSIITINLNNKAGLERTIQSVSSQSFSDFEYILIDGGSDDGSQDIINKYADKITFWSSEKDSGIYNAMNKGISKANGKYCLFLNSGDILIKSTILKDILNFINDEDILYGNGFYEADGNRLEKLECPEKLTLGFFSVYSLFHPATLIRKDLFKIFGQYNESNQIISDSEFFIKTIILNKVKTKLIPLEIAIAEDNGISRKPEYKELLESEATKMLDNLFPDYVSDLMRDYRDLKLENFKLSQGKNQIFSELSVYKSNRVFRAILKLMRFFRNI